MARHLGDPVEEPEHWNEEYSTESGALWEMFEDASAMRQGQSQMMRLVVSGSVRYVYVEMVWRDDEEEQ